jgi:hypothetical protein
MGRRKVAVEVGKMFGKLTVKELLPVINGHAMAKCICSCGKEYVCRSSGLTSGHNKSCGCRHEDVLKRGARFKHGQAYTKLYKVWAGMLQRCENINASNYSNYGGRGISVCIDWHNPEVFIEWAMSHGYEEGLSIDRIDNDDNYCPENCQWITVSENTRKANAERRKVA